LLIAIGGRQAIKCADCPEGSRQERNLSIDAILPADSGDAASPPSGKRPAVSFAGVSMTHLFPAEWTPQARLWIGFPGDPAEWPCAVPAAQYQAAAFATAVAARGQAVS